MRLLAQATPNSDVESVFGTIQAPEAVQRYGLIGGSGAGPTGFISNIIVLITIIAGIWALFNIISAGVSVITSDGDSKKVGEMASKITNTFIGLLIMVAAPLLTALIGLFFFGDAGYFLNPTILGPGGM